MIGTEIFKKCKKRLKNWSFQTGTSKSQVHPTPSILFLGLKLGGNERLTLRNHLPKFQSKKQNLTLLKLFFQIYKGGVHLSNTPLYKKNKNSTLSDAQPSVNFTGSL